jgi:hypothetical protein
VTAPVRPERKNPFEDLASRLQAGEERGRQPSNPFGDLARQARGEKPEGITVPAGRESEQTPQPPAQREEDGPNVLERAVATGKQIVTHPIESIKGVAKAVWHDAKTVANPTNVIGSGQMPGSTRFGDEQAIANARSGRVTTRENTPGAVT